MKTYKHIAVVAAMVMTLSIYPPHLLYSQANNSKVVSTVNNPFKWLRPIEEKNIRLYSNGLAAFHDGISWGFVDINGKVKIRSQFEDVKDFRNGLAIVKKDGAWGVIDTEGKNIIPFEFDSIEDFTHQIALAKKDDVSYYLYTDGKQKRLPSEYEFFSYSEDGLAKVMKKGKKGNKYGYVNTKGGIVIDEIYDQASDFAGGYAVVSKKGEVFIINTLGAKYTLKEAAAFENIELTTEKGTGFLKVEGNKYKLLTHSGKSFSPSAISFQKINSFNEGYALVRYNDVLRFIDKDGSIKLDVRGFDNAGAFYEGKAWVSSNGKYGYINTSGKLIIDTTLTYASDFSNGYAYIVNEGRKGIIRTAYPTDRFPKVEISSIKLRDSNGNEKVETDEVFLLDVTVRNTGNESARGIHVTLSGKGEQATWISYDSRVQTIESIGAGEEATISFKGTANTELVSSDIVINMNAVADNILYASNSSLEFHAIGINLCKPLLASYWAHTPDHSPIGPGKDNIFEFSVTNDGTDIAKDVKIMLRWPEGIKNAPATLTLGNIAPGESKKIETKFDIAAEHSTSRFSVVATVTDYTRKHDDVKYLAFESNTMNLAVNLLNSSGANQMLEAQMAALYAMNADASSKASDKAALETSELLSGITKIKETNANRYALVIGNEDYNSQKTAAIYEPNVDYANRDAQAFAQYAENFFGIPKDNILLLEDATYGIMRRNLNKIASIAKSNPNVELFVYYAGHAQVDMNSKDCYLIPVDISTTAPSEGIKLEEFYATLSESGAKRSYVFLDACYSGIGRGITLSVKQAAVKGNLMVMTASSATQKSMPYAEKKHGMFTYYLLKNIKDSQGNISIEDLFENVRKNVQTSSTWINNMEQTPELICGPGIDEGWQNWTL